MINIRAKSFVTIMIVIAISALLLRVLIERIIRFNIAQNEEIASVALKFTCASLENYAKDNQGIYPKSLSALMQTKPAYLQKKYIDGFILSPFRGYNYSCSLLDESGYSCIASPTNCRLTGRMIYSISNGSVFKSEECEKREQE